MIKQRKHVVSAIRENIEQININFNDLSCFKVIKNIILF